MYIVLRHAFAEYPSPMYWNIIREVIVNHRILLTLGTFYQHRSAATKSFPKYNYTIWMLWLWSFLQPYFSYIAMVANWWHKNDPVALLWSKRTLMIEVHCCTSVTDSELGWLRVHLDHGSALQSQHCKEQVYNKGEATHLHSQYTKTKQCLDFRQKSQVHFGVLSWLRSIHIVCLSLLCFLYETSSVAKWKLTSSPVISLV